MISTTRAGEHEQHEPAAARLVDDRRGAGGWGEGVVAGLVALLLASTFLIRGLPPGVAPVCVDPLYADVHAVPFSEVRPDGFEAHNAYLSDHALVFYPWLRFMSEAVRGGEIPWWTPHSGGGVPFIGNLSSAFFFPTTWLSFLPPDVMTVARGMWFAAVIRLVVAGLFGFLFLRRLGFGRAGSAAGGVGFMLFGYQVVWLFYSLSNVACLIPLCLFLTDRFASRPSAGRGAALAVVLALQFLGGHAETSVATAIAAGAWFVARATAPDRPRPVAGMLARFAGVGVASLGLCAFQLLPFVEYLMRSWGRLERLTARPPTFDRLDLDSMMGLVAASVGGAALVLGFRRLRDAGRAVLRPGIAGGVLLAIGIAALLPLGLRPQLLLLFEPDLFGSPLTGGYRGPETYTDVNGGYAGAFAAVLAVLYVLGGANRRVATTFGSLFAFAWILPGHVEPFHSLLKSIPPFDLAANTRMLPLSGVAISVLAAAAVDQWVRRGARDLVRAALRLAIAVVIVIGASATFPWFAGLVATEDAEAAAGGVAWVSPSPEDDARLEPTITARRTGRLVVSMTLDVPAGTTDLAVHAGDGYAARRRVDPTVTAAGGPVTVEWDATRFEPGRYTLVPVATDAGGVETRGAPLALWIDRSPHLTMHGAVRLAIILLLLLPLASLLAAHAVILAWIVPVVIAVELFLFGFDYNAYVDESIVYPPTSVTDFLRAEDARWRLEGRGPFRVLTENVILQPNMHYAYDLQTPRSYDQLENARFNQFRADAFQGAGMMSYNRHTIDYQSPLLGVLNVAYIVTADRLDSIPTLELAHESSAGRVYRNRSVLDRAFVVGDALDLRARSRAELLAYDPRTTAFLEVPPPAPLGGRGTARIESYRLNEVVVDVEADGSALLVLTDNDFPGWSATVNGSDAPILRTHLTFRAVPVSAGASRVVFSYRPGSVRVGFILAALSALALVGAGIGAGIRAGPRRR